MNFFQKALMISGMAIAGIVGSNKEAVAQKTPDTKVTKEKLALLDKTILASFDRVDAVTIDTVKSKTGREVRADITGHEKGRVERSVGTNEWKNGNLTVRAQDTDHNGKLGRGEVTRIIASDLDENYRIYEHGIELEHDASDNSTHVSLESSRDHFSTSGDVSVERNEQALVEVELYSDVKDYNLDTDQTATFSGISDLFKGNIHDVLDVMRTSYMATEVAATNKFDKDVLNGFSEIGIVNKDTTNNIAIMGRDVNGMSMYVSGKDLNNNDRLDMAELEFANIHVNGGVFKDAEVSILNNLDENGKIVNRKEHIDVLASDARSIRRNLKEFTPPENKLSPEAKDVRQTLRDGLRDKEKYVTIKSGFTDNLEQIVAHGDPMTRAINVAFQLKNAPK